MDDRIQKVFRQLFTPVPGERAAAADAVVAMADREGLAPTDLTLVHTRDLHGSLYQQRLRLQTDVERLGEDLAFLKGRSAEKVQLGEALRWMNTRKTRRDHWPEIREQARRRLFNGKWPAETQAYQMLARAVGVQPDDVRAWREGTVEVPDAIRERLKTIEPGQKRKIAVKKVVQIGKTPFGDNALPANEYRILRTLLGAGTQGLHSTKVEEQTGIGGKTVSSRLSNLRVLGLVEATRKPGFSRATAKALSIHASDGVS
jgi:hypothetical protein